jgi:hypothetical protein
LGIFFPMKLGIGLAVFFRILGGLLVAMEIPSAPRQVDLSAAQGPLTQEMAGHLFGQKRFSPERGWAEVHDGILTVTFKKGKKVEGTGLSLHVPVETTGTRELQFRIRYPEDFPAGIHGKQMGFSGGRGYDGGRGQEARENGDGWSARMMFTAKPAGVEIGLYVYHADMKAKYGDPLGAEKFLIPRTSWHAIRFVVTPQTSPKTADGKIEVWCDGERKIYQDGIRFARSVDAVGVNRVRLELFPGGGGDFPTRDLKVDIAELAW